MLIKSILICFLLEASSTSANGILSNNNNNNNHNYYGQSSRHTNERHLTGNNNSNNSKGNNRKSAISDLLQGYTSGQFASRVAQQQTSRLAKGLARSVAAIPVAMSLVVAPKEYECAKYCTCSLVQVIERAESGAQSSMERKVNLTQAKCESSQFTDLLTIDRRTQIIHISLPLLNSSASSQQQEQTDGLSDLPIIPPDSAVDEATSISTSSQQVRSFRMPRLVQFNLLREIVIINLRFEVCDSEVFKRGQRLRRLQLNHNRLTRISKACLKHLDRLIELNLDHNQLEELESALFNSLLNLRSLSIAHNHLTDLAAHQFANLTELVSLNLIGNSFKSINLQLFEPMQSSLKMLMLAGNKIKSFIHSSPPVQTVTNSNQPQQQNGKLSPQPFQGVIFRRLVKLNMDNNKIERIKLLQLHRFFNVKFLSIRNNNIATIRDKAFNGLKLSELNLAHNQLQSISRCAFCNATIKRLVLAHNNISLAQVVAAGPTAGSGILAPSGTTATLATATRPLEAPSLLNDTFTRGELPGTPATTHNMVILSQSVVGPLFNQLEYLDVSANEHLGEQLDLLLEPLLKLEYLNLANVGLDPYLPNPSLFKNLRQLRYLNLSYNQLDQLLAESIEPLQQLELLDLSHNKFSELDESLLVVIDELPLLKLVKLSENPWYCSQCKVAPLYDWILRSPIYNQTCISPSNNNNNNNNSPTVSENFQGSDSSREPANEQNEDPLSTTYNTQAQDYGLLMKRDEQHLLSSVSEGAAISARNELYIEADLTAYEGNSYFEEDPALLSLLLASSKMYGEEDNTLVETMLLMDKLSTNYLGQTYSASEYCLRCEFPGELRSFAIHELSAGDFKFCAGAAPRFSASEPKIGLTLAIVIIGVLFCIIIVVIVIYRRKSSTYYPNEFDPDQITGASGGALESAGAGKRPVFSVSSDADGRGYGDATDYSSPPMSQSSYSAGPDEDFVDEDEEFVDEEDEGELDEELDDEDGEEEEEDEEEVDIDDVEEEKEHQLVSVEKQLSPVVDSTPAHLLELELEKKSVNSGSNKVREEERNHKERVHKMDQDQRANTSTSGQSALSQSSRSEQSSSGPSRTNAALARSASRQATPAGPITTSTINEGAGTGNTTIHQSRLPPVKRASSSRASSGSIALIRSLSEQREDALVLPANLEDAQQQVVAAAAATTVTVVPQAGQRQSGAKVSSPDQQQVSKQASNPMRIHTDQGGSHELTRHTPLSRKRFAISRDAQKSQPLGPNEWGEHTSERVGVEPEIAPRSALVASSEATSADSLVIELDAASSLEHMDQFGPASCSPNGGALEGVANSSDEEGQGAGEQPIRQSRARSQLSAAPPTTRRKHHHNHQRASTGTGAGKVNAVHSSHSRERYEE